jgi:hypothetical protein
MFFRIQLEAMDKRHLQPPLVILEIDPAIMGARPFYFTDGNAAARKTRFFSKLEDIDQYPWKEVNRDRWSGLFWSAEKRIEMKRKKAAEVLIQTHLPIVFIRAIHLASQEDWKRLPFKRLGSLKDRCCVSPRLFFKDLFRTRKGA